MRGRERSSSGEHQRRATEQQISKGEHKDGRGAERSEEQRSAAEETDESTG